MKKYMLNIILLVFPVLMYSSLATAACPIIPGPKIIDAYCSSAKSPFNTDLGEYVNLVGDTLPDCKGIKKMALTARKSFQKTPYEGTPVEGEHEVGKTWACKYTFHTGKEDDPKRGTYEFQIQPLRK